MVSFNQSVLGGNPILIKTDMRVLTLFNFFSLGSLFQID